MNNVWTTILLVIVCVVAGYFLGQVWAPFGWAGFIGMLVIIGMYFYKRWRRIQ